MSVNVYLVGSYKDYSLNFIGLIETEDGKKMLFKKTMSGSQPEAEAKAAGSVLKYLFDNKVNANIYTTFSSAYKWAVGEYKPNSQTAKEFVNFLKNIRKLQSIEFYPEIPAEMTAEVQQYAKRASINLDKEQDTISSDNDNPFKKKKEVSSEVRWKSTSSEVRWKTTPKKPFSKIKRPEEGPENTLHHNAAEDSAKEKSFKKAAYTEFFDKNCMGNSAVMVSEINGIKNYSFIYGAVVDMYIHKKDILKCCSLWMKEHYAEVEFSETDFDKYLMNSKRMNDHNHLLPFTLVPSSIATYLGKEFDQKYKAFAEYVKNVEDIRSIAIKKQSKKEESSYSENSGLFSDMDANSDAARKTSGIYKREESKIKDSIDLFELADLQVDVTTLQSKEGFSLDEIREADGLSDEKPVKRSKKGKEKESSDQLTF